MQRFKKACASNELLRYLVCQKQEKLYGREKKTYRATEDPKLEEWNLEEIIFRNLNF